MNRRTVTGWVLLVLAAFLMGASLVDHADHLIAPAAVVAYFILGFDYLRHRS